MGIQHHHNDKSFVNAGWRVASKPCDLCKLSTAAVFCRADLAFLCLTCDSKIHGANKLASRHERVWMCEVCEQAPAAVTCRADAASLCVTCDADIHSVNPLARRHERVPVEPFFDSPELIVKSSGFNGSADDCTEISDAETAAWLIPNLNIDKKSEIMFFSEMDPFLDFDYPNSIDTRFEHNTGNDSVVPVQTQHVPTPPPVINRSSEICFDIDFCRSKLSSFSYQSQSLSQSISSSSLDVGVVPDGNCMSETSFSFGQNMNSGIDATFRTTNQATQLCGMDREARVLRYREKRKNRKFEKTIRYASRKAYAETRPRIKGRFAKRTNAATEADRLYSSVSAAFLADCQYGVVPTYH